MRLRRLGAMLLTLIFCLITVTAALAASSAGLTLEAGAADGSGCYPVTVNLSDGSHAAMIQFTLGYDADKLECAGMTAGSATGAAAPTMSSQTGQIYYVWDALTPIETGGTLVTVLFKPLVKDASIAVWIDTDEELIIADENFNELDVDTENCVIEQAAETADAPGAAATAAPVDTALADGVNMGLTLDKNALYLVAGEKASLKVTDAQDTVVWSSSNEGVAAVDNGKVSTLTPGTAVISANAADGADYATCSVHVYDSRQALESAVQAVPGGEAALQAQKGPSPVLWVILAVAVLLIAAAVIFFLRKRRKTEDNAIRSDAE